MKTFVHVIFVVVLLAEFVDARTPFELRIQKINCEALDPAVLQITKCSVKPKNRTTTFINVGINVTQRVDSLMLNGQLLKKNHITFKPFLINVTEDLCEFFGKNRGGVYLRIVAKIYQPYSNLKHPCPYIGPHYITDLPVHEDQIPVIWPFGVYRMDLAFYEHNKPIFLITQLFFELKERSIF